MRRAIIAGAVLGFAVCTTAGTALAAPPEVQQKSCEANQGTFDRDHGVKSCTTTTVHTVTTDGEGPPQTISSPGGLVTVKYTGMIRETDILRTTTTQTWAASTGWPTVRCRTPWCFRVPPSSTAWRSLRPGASWPSPPECPTRSSERE